MRDDLYSLGEQIAEEAAHLDAAQHRFLTKVRQFDEGGGWFHQGFRTCAQWLSWRVSMSPGVAREHVRVANALAKTPLIDEAMSKGELSYSKVRALTRVATPENESVLLEQARLTTGHQLEQICRKYASVRNHDFTGAKPVDDQFRRYVTFHDTEDGMVAMKGVFHPEEAAMIRAAIERIAAERCREREDASAGTSASAAPAAIERIAAERCPEREDVPAGRSASAAPPAIERIAAERCREREDVPAGTSASAAPAASAPEVPVTDAVDASTEAGSDTLPDLAPFKNVPAATLPAATSPAKQTQSKNRPAFDRADALLQMAQQVLRGNSPNRSPTNLLISIPLETLQDTHHHDPMNVACCPDGTCISSAAARRLACDAGLVAMVEDERGNVLAAGRKRRTISGSQKRALLRRDRTCRFPGCTARVFLEGHHLRHWIDGGNTELRNLVLLCSFHHRFVHEYGFTIELHDDGGVTAYTPEGRVVPAVIEMPKPRDLGWPNILRRNEGLGLTPETQETWDGSPCIYAECVDWICREDLRNGAAWAIEADKHVVVEIGCRGR